MPSFKIFYYKSVIFIGAMWFKLNYFAIFNPDSIVFTGNSYRFILCFLSINWRFANAPFRVYMMFRIVFIFSIKIIFLFVFKRVAWIRRLFIFWTFRIFRVFVVISIIFRFIFLLSFFLILCIVNKPFYAKSTYYSNRDDRSS